MDSIQSPLSEDDIKFLNMLDNDQLYTIMEADSFSEFEDAKAQKDLPLRRMARKLSAHISMKKNKITQSIYAALTDAPSAIYVMLGSIAYLSFMEVSMLIFLSAGLLAAAVAASAVYLVSTYREEEKKQRKTEKAIQLALLKIECEKIYIARFDKKNEHASALETEWDKVPEKPVKHRLIKLKYAMGSAVLVTSTLLSTYFVSVNAVFAALGLTMLAGAMGGPLVIGLSIAVAVLVGLTFGYKQYQAHVNEEKLDKLEGEIQYEVKIKFKLCRRLREKCFQTSMVDTLIERTVAAKKTQNEISLSDHIGQTLLGQSGKRERKQSGVGFLAKLRHSFNH